MNYDAIMNRCFREVAGSVVANLEPLDLYQSYRLAGFPVDVLNGALAEAYSHRHDGVNGAIQAVYTSTDSTV